MAVAEHQRSTGPCDSVRHRSDARIATACNATDAGCDTEVFEEWRGREMTVYELIQKLAYSDPDTHVYVRVLCDMDNLKEFGEEGGIDAGWVDIDSIDERMDGVEIVLKPLEL